MSKLAAPVCRRPRHRGESLAHTFHEIRDDLVNTLYFLLGSYDDAQDAAQEAFLKCWRVRRQIKDIRNPRAWIFRVGLNAAKDLQRCAWRRRARPLAAALTQEPRLRPSPADWVVNAEALQRLRRALMDLRPEEKEVFLLRQNGDLTYDEIAELNDRPVGTVKTQMRTALIKLRQVLQENNEEREQ
jgi:RNA polymerase sigma-70 factor (ECF subfamily)